MTLIQQMPSLTICTTGSSIACGKKLWAQRALRTPSLAEEGVGTVVAEVDPLEEDTLAAVEVDMNPYIPTAVLTYQGVF